MRPLRGLQETRVATREESGVLGFPSRRGAWRIPGTGEPGGLPSMGSHRVRHDFILTSYEENGSLGNVNILPMVSELVAKSCNLSSVTLTLAFAVKTHSILSP